MSEKCCDEIECTRTHELTTLRARVEALEGALRQAIGAWDHVNWMTEAYADCKRRDMEVYMEGAEDMRKARSVLSTRSTK